MLDPALPPSIGALLRDLERRIRNLEVGGRLDSSSIRPGGYIRGYNVDDERILEVGHLIGGGYGFAVNNVDPTKIVLWVGDDGWRIPLLYYPWREDFPVWIYTTSASFVSTWQCELPGPMGTVLTSLFYAAADVATTAEYYVQIVDIPGTVLATSNTVTLTGAGAHLISLQWLHGISFDQARNVIVRIYVRRVSGVGTGCGVAEPDRMSVSNYQATTTPPLVAL